MSNAHCAVNSDELRRRTGGSIKQTKLSLAGVLRAPEAKHEFDEARTRHPALARHDSLLSVLGVLGDESEQRREEQDAILRALIAEAQSARSNLWSHVLSAAFYPMLARQRRRVQGDVFAAAELDQLVAWAFLESVASFPLWKHVGFTAVELKRRTWKRVANEVQREQRLQQMIAIVAPEDLASIVPADSFVAEAPEDRFLTKSADWPETDRQARSRYGVRDSDGTLFDLLLKTVGDAVDRDDLEVVAATFLAGRRLRAYVMTILPSATEAAQSREYARLKRARSRVIRAISPLLLSLIGPRTDAQRL